MIPGDKKKPFYRKKWLTELVGPIPTLVAAGVTAYLNYVDPAKRHLSYWLTGGIVWLVGVTGIKVANEVAEAKEAKKKRQHEGLRGAVRVLYSMIMAQAGLEDNHDGQLRITIHRVIPSEEKPKRGEELEQILPYFGSNDDGLHRRFSVNVGIIGRVVREKEPLFATRENEDPGAFIKELVRNWGFTEADARSVLNDRRAWLAVPVTSNEREVIAVIYLDSNHRDFFTSSIIQSIVNGCEGMVSYIREKYQF
jgi:hypothetical protein